jgi:hypothetical protein
MGGTPVRNGASSAGATLLLWALVILPLAFPNLVQGRPLTSRVWSIATESERGASAHRTLLAGGLPVAPVSLPLTKTDPPGAAATTSAFVRPPQNGTGGETGVLGSTTVLATTNPNPVPLLGGFLTLPSFTAKMLVGTPPQEQNMIIDTCGNSVSDQLLLSARARISSRGLI